MLIRFKLVPLPQRHPDRNIREEEKKKIADLYKGHTTIIQYIIFVPRYLKQLGMNPIAHISAEQEEDEPERNEDKPYNKAPDQNAGKNF